jgi:DNA-directed RNA polymerase beta' subunit
VISDHILTHLRNVIIPDPLLKVDEIELCYLTFLELYKYEILSHLCKMDNITIAEASELWFKATINFNKKIYEVMKYLLKKKKVKMLINRNPKRLGHLYNANHFNCWEFLRAS